MPGVAALVSEQIEALKTLAGEKTVALIKRQPDPVIERIVAGWPRNFDASRATSLGFKAEHTFLDILRTYIDDEHVHPGA